MREVQGFSEEPRVLSANRFYLVAFDAFTGAKATREASITLEQNLALRDPEDEVDAPGYIGWSQVREEHRRWRRRRRQRRRWDGRREREDTKFPHKISSMGMLSYPLFLWARARPLGHVKRYTTTLLLNTSKSVCLLHIGCETILFFSPDDI